MSKPPATQCCNPRARLIGAVSEPRSGLVATAPHIALARLADENLRWLGRYRMVHMLAWRREPALGNRRRNDRRENDDRDKQRELGPVDDVGRQAIERANRAEREPGAHKQRRERRVWPGVTTSERIDQPELWDHLRRHQHAEHAKIRE